MTENQRREYLKLVSILQSGMFGMNVMPGSFRSEETDLTKLRRIERKEAAERMREATERMQELADWGKRMVHEMPAPPHKEEMKRTYSIFEKRTKRKC